MGIFILRPWADRTSATERSMDGLERVSEGRNPCPGVQLAPLGKHGNRVPMLLVVLPHPVFAVTIHTFKTRQLLTIQLCPA